MSKGIFGRIESPCMVSFNSLQGDREVRYCGECKLNVYNFAEFTDNEVKVLIANAPERICASIRKRADGSIYTDNCPRRFRRLRNWMRAYAPAVLTLVSCLFHQSAADAQGLVGAPIEGRFGQSNEVGELCSSSYDVARDCVSVSTFLAAAVSFGLMTMQRLRDAQTIILLKNRLGLCRFETKNLVRNRVIQLLALLALPLLVHLIGMWAINTRM